MDFLNNIKMFERLFEDSEIINEMDRIIAEIKKYDIYNIVARISALNLIPQNQNKSILLDSLIANILREKEESYNSNLIMSHGKFRKLLERLNNTNLTMSVDPNENAFVQNIMFTENYTVFNGIDFIPAHNLQMLIDILFNCKNDFPNEYLQKTKKMLKMVLTMSDELSSKIDIKNSDIISDEGRKIIIPDGSKISEYASYVVFEEQRLKKILGDYSNLLDESSIFFGTGTLGSMDNRPFYCKPFIKNNREKKIILLNVSLLPTFVLSKTLNIADEFGIKNKVIKRFNEYVWQNCIKSLMELEHYKINESKLGIELINKNYFKEMIVSVYNNQLMLVFFVCDDAEDYVEATMHDFYPDGRHTLILEERMMYYCKQIQKEKIDIDNIFCMIVISGIGRGISIGISKSPSKYKTLKLNPFELHCIKINEQKRTNFIPKYIRAKDKINTNMLSIFSELNAISIYTSNEYSFYMSDDLNLSESMVYIAPGDSVGYINQAIKEEDAVLVDSYIDYWKSRVKLSDRVRNIYIEDSMAETKRITICIRFSNCIIWITSDEIIKKIEIDLYYSIIDALSFWLAECKVIIENMDFSDTLYHFNIVLEGDRKTYYYAPDEVTQLTGLITIEGNSRHYDLIWSSKAFGQMSYKTNVKEKEMCQIVLDILNKNTNKPYDYTENLNIIFDNPIKKKFFSFDFEDMPYLEPTKTFSNRIVHREDEDFLLDIIGKSVLETGKWGYGIIPNAERTNIANYVVGILYRMLQSEIENLSSNNIIEIIYLDLEEAIYKLMLARARYAYDLACYPEKEEIYMKEYDNLNQTSMALKFMMEYIAAKPPKGNIVLGIGKYEYILAICSLIINWAYKNDLFYYNIFNTPVEILKSERIGMKQTEFFNMYEYSDKYRREQLYYNSSSDFRKSYNITHDDFSKDLDEAFLSEYGYTFSQFYKVTMEIINCGKEREEGEVFVENKDVLKEYLLGLDSELTLDVIGKVIKDISLTERNDFLKLPSKFRKEDVYPWRFNRDYSFNRRPIVIRNNDVIWGNRQLHHMLLYVIDLIYDGKIRTKDTKMATLIGRISDSRGRKFNKLIEDMLLDMKVFKIHSNIEKMNNNFIVDENGNKLGDIDILIIDEKMHNIYVTEVKDFNFSRNPYEIQMEYQKMFVDGKEKSYLNKHNRRVDWVREHLEDLKMQYGLSNINWKISCLFIVSKPLISMNVYGKNIKAISKSELSVEKIRGIN